MLHRRFVHDPYGLVSNSATRFGWGPKITAFRVLIAMMHLKRTVEVGLVIGRKGEDDADWLGDLHQAAFRKLADGADGTFVLYVVVDELRGHHVLDGLVFQNPEPGLLDRETGQMLGLFHPGHDHRLDDAIDVLLCVLGKDGGSGSGLTDESFQVGGPLATQALGSRRDPNRLLYCIAGAHVPPPS